MSTSAMTYMEAIRDALVEEMRRDPRVFLLGEDIGAYGGAFKLTEGLLEEFGPERVIDTPISESGILGAAIGAAYMGMRPVVEIQFMDFVTCCYQMIANVAAKSHWRWGAAAPIVIRGPVGAGVGAGPFHSQSVEALFHHLPGLKIVMPSTPDDAKELMKAAIRDPNPVLFLEHKLLYRHTHGKVLEGEQVAALGKARRRREGKDMTLITYGAMVHEANAAAETLYNEDGAEIEVIDLRTLQPIDWATLYASVQKTSKVLVLHEDHLTGGIGAEIAARIGQDTFEWLDAPVTRMGAADTPVPYAKNLEKAFLPGGERLLQGCRELLAY